MEDSAAVGTIREALLARFAGREEPPSISERLAKKFGYGTNRRRRLELYQRLQALEAQHGESVLQAIGEAVAQAVGARNPGHYFCRAVCLKLRERGVYYAPGKGVDPTW